ncbi:hypothetical protein H0H92_007159 [Tricholoma furcatifolium]|nr:hypothetical protein H0H92_007159 [Tricholoma furcatifolium]
MSAWRCQYMAPILRTSDGIALSCILLPQTRESLDRRNPKQPEQQQQDELQDAEQDIEQPEQPEQQQQLEVEEQQDEQRDEQRDERVELTPAAAEARATIIVFHGNAMHNYDDMHTPMTLFKMKCNVFLLSYRGFSGGTPSEAGLRIDAQTALNYILSQPYLAKVPIILYGHSLGGGVAIDLAARNPTLISGVIVSNTFTSIPDLVRTWPVIGVFSFICTQKWRSKDKLRKISADTPILMISGRNDEVIPAHLMDRLWEAAQKRGLLVKSSFPWPMCSSTPEDTADPAETNPVHDKFVKIRSGTHNSTPTYREYWSAMRKFVKKVATLAKDRPQNDPSPNIKYTEPDFRWRVKDLQFVIVPPPEQGT